MALENGAAALRRPRVYVGDYRPLSVIAAALGARAIGQDAPVVGTAVITNVDTRMGPASVITTWILPVIGACFRSFRGGHGAVLRHQQKVARVGDAVPGPELRRAPADGFELQHPAADSCPCAGSPRGSRPGCCRCPPLHSERAPQQRPGRGGLALGLPRRHGVPRVGSLSWCLLLLRVLRPVHRVVARQHVVLGEGAEEEALPSDALLASVKSASRAENRAAAEFIAAAEEVKRRSASTTPGKGGRAGPPRVCSPRRRGGRSGEASRGG